MKGERVVGASFGGGKVMGFVGVGGKHDLQKGSDACWHVLKDFVPALDIYFLGYIDF